MNGGSIRRGGATRLVDDPGRAGFQQRDIVLATQS